MKMIFDGTIIAFRLSDEYGSHFRIKESEIDNIILRQIEERNNPCISPIFVHKGIRRMERIWKGMLARCKNSNLPAYKYYGGKGIKVCERWKSFEFFVQDMGFAPFPWSIDRIDSNKGYYPENCVWSTYKGQAKHRIISKTYKFYECDGKKVSLFEYAKIKNLNYHTLVGRIRRGFSMEDVFYEGLFQKGKKREKMKEIKC